ncbi:hypothetical protein [uncultured Endozoicomonas sp.]|uniref:hypothetical protein n=1 Tax=uncultured Endozoicomonas sp. TaxID=432652 RepID=UPI0026205EE6|nr:hypothetical protein [uncultured Endozoicomonas sp.]
MSFLDWINPFNKVVDLASELIEDPDKVNEFRHQATMAGKELQKMAEETYRKELDTKTVPWVDALHKMGRQIASYVGYGLAFYMVHKGYDPMAAMAALAPGGIYSYVKGRGK